MTMFLTFTSADLDRAYAEIYEELAGYLEIAPHEAARCFVPDDAIARVRYHRRQASRRGLQAELARVLGIEPGAVFAAVGEEGARILLEAIQAKPCGEITTHESRESRLLSELEDAMGR